MDFHYRNVPECVFKLIIKKVSDLSLIKKRRVSQSEAITTLLKSLIVEEKKD